MTLFNKKESPILFVGDILLLFFALWLTLFIRYGEVPGEQLWDTHVIPFAILFLVWTIVFFIAGLYEKHTLILKSRLPSVILNAQILNSIIAVLFFYLIPYFVITPKTVLFIYLLISFTFILAWRLYGVPSLGFRKRQKAILIGSGEEMKELLREVNENSRYSLQFISFIDLNKIEGLDFEEEILNRIYSEGVSTVVADLKNEKVESILPRLYNLIFSHVRFLDTYKVYEDIFDRTPLSLVGYNWFLENISSSSHITYDFLKRIMDIVVSLTGGTVSLLAYPFIALAIKIDDGGPVFIKQKRVGKNGMLFSILKFRTMQRDDRGEQLLASENETTRTGTFLRKSRLDELPQLWNIFFGEMSLTGPRPELPELVDIYKKEIPYYRVRLLIKPGLSGWAQIYHDEHPHHGPDVVETKRKLSYDLFYIKNRSFFLDIKIALKTLRILISRTGR